MLQFLLLWIYKRFQQPPIAPARDMLRDLFIFTLKQARAALFPGVFLFSIFASSYLAIPGLYRYDLLFIAAVAIQIFMLIFKLETVDEAKTIVLFHLIGLVLEIYKTNPAIGSWAYPEAGYLKVFGVPLYSGFMYACVGSYIAHAWKAFNLKLVDWLLWYNSERPHASLGQIPPLRYICNQLTPRECHMWWTRTTD